MIAPGDRVAVGVSGGKDSLLLLYAMALYRRFCPHPFELIAVTLTMGMEPFDLSGVRALCERLEVPYTVRETQIGKVIFEERKEKNPCSLCAKMRRGALSDLCRELGANKVALGHHRDDAIETLLLSMFYEGRMHTFHPVTYLSRSNLTPHGVPERKARDPHGEGAGSARGALPLPGQRLHQAGGNEGAFALHLQAHSQRQRAAVERAAKRGAIRPVE